MLSLLQNVTIVDLDKDGKDDVNLKAVKLISLICKPRVEKEKSEEKETYLHPEKFSR
jgi:hypothetical protein